MPGREIVILSAARTPIGKYGGALRDLHPAELGATAARAAIARAGVQSRDIDEVWIGHARQAGSGPNPGRQVAHRAGIPYETPAQTVNKACASGLQAIVSGAQSILAGDADVVLAGGIESMSRMPYLIDSVDARWGHRMGHFGLVDAMYRDGFHCPLCNQVMGETAETLARNYGITRDQSDCFALESQRKARAAMDGGHFVREIASVGAVSRDEHPRETTLELLRALPLVFGDGIITAGSSSGITDGGAAVVLSSAEKAGALGLKPRARIVGWASAGVDPAVMGVGPVPAIRKLERRTGLRVDDFDLVELNEAFAPQVLAVLQEIPISADRLNVNGGAIALGHPIGCTGTRIVVSLVHELERRGGALGLATLCVSGGMGMALAIERCASQ